MLPAHEKPGLDKLRGLIGRRVRHHGLECRIIEVLEDGPALVLQDLSAHDVIQPDQHGEAHRRVAELYTVLAWDAAADALHTDFAALELMAEQ
ncbi:MAG: hypothetical protein M1527_03505 [Gammaproteobacteria bacterium]|nr:hypothetical protein [Gammaproteobacteria bacterium]